MVSTKPAHPDFVEVKAPHRVPLTQPSVFLAGSIEMGKAILWQDAMSAELSDLPVTVLNPRRSDWNSEWKQTEDFGPFKEQVDWEMDHLDDCSVIALYFQPGTQSPISLLELGMHAASRKVIVCCPEGFWRRGNVQMVCSRYGLTRVETIEELITQTRKKLMEKVKERKSEA